MPLVGLEPDENTARLITLVVLLIQAVLVIASTRIVGHDQRQPRWGSKW